jgi:hypothetical protein
MDVTRVPYQNCPATAPLDVRNKLGKSTADGMLAGKALLRGIMESGEAGNLDDNPLAMPVGARVLSKDGMFPGGALESGIVGGGDAPMETLGAVLDGDLVGDLKAPGVIARVGALVANVGWAEGGLVGDAASGAMETTTGESVGDWVDVATGDSVSATIGDPVGDTVGDAVDATKGKLVGDCVDVATGDSVSVTAGGSVGEAVGDSVVGDIVIAIVGRAVVSQHPR